MPDNQDDRTIGELTRTLVRVEESQARMEEKLDSALAEQGRLKTELAVMKIKVAAISSAIAGGAVLVLEGVKSVLFAK